MKDYPFERLIFDLLEKEDNFEMALALEHVEDKLIAKQVIPFDEMSMLSGPGAPRVWVYLFMDLLLDEELNGFTKKFESKVYKLIRTIIPHTSIVNRQRRNFRMLRDWIGGRAW